MIETHEIIEGKAVVLFDNVKHLVIWRNEPYKFILSAAEKAAISPNMLFTNSETGRSGAYDLIEYMKNYALAKAEVWSVKDLQNTLSARVLFILYYSDENIVLSYSKSDLNENEVNDKYSADKVFYRSQASEINLISLINEFLEWLKN